MLTNALVKSALKQKTLKVELQGKIINGTLKMKIMLLNMKVISNNKNGVEIKKEVTDEGAEEEVGVIDKVIGEALNDVLNAARKDILLMPVQIQMLKGAQGVHKNALNAERKAINHSNVQRLGNSARGSIMSLSSTSIAKYIRMKYLFFFHFFFFYLISCYLSLTFWTIPFFVK